MENQLELPKEGVTVGAKAIIETLLAAGVNRIFGYPGGTVIPFYDALYEYKGKMTHILTRHEQGAVHAAEGFARATGKVGVCVATSGPGATNLVTGIADAMMDSVPVVCITGQVPNHLLGSDAFQETDFVSITIPITKWNCRVKDARQLPEIIAKAIHIATTGRPGPVVIDVPRNVQVESFNWDEVSVEVPSYNPVRDASNDDILQAAGLINAAKRPLILCGHGVLICDAEKELIELAEMASIPVAVTFMGISAIPTEHPLYAGMIGMHGNYAPNYLTNKSDLIIAVGMRFSDRVTGDTKRYAKNAKIIHIELDSSEINKNVSRTFGIVSDAKRVLKRLLPLVKKLDRAAWLAEFKSRKQLEDEKIIKKAIKSSGSSISMSEAVYEISKQVDGDAIVVTDVGQQQMMTARYFSFKDPKTFISSGGLGTMGFGLPAAIGAKMACPEKRVITFLGDGGFQMTMQELGTILQENLDVKIVILNNEYLGMVRQWQELFFKKRYSFVGMKNPDFVAIAKAYGMNAQRVVGRGDLKGAVSKMLSSEGAYLLEIVVDKTQNVFPMIPGGAAIDEMILQDNEEK
ncbi:acetolactate synthase [Bacteroidia bacterium]|nr:acetolactate synthase [Bacteroidia bacterium]